MTIAAQLGERAESIGQREAKGAKLAFMLLKYRGASDAHAHCEVERVSPRVRDTLKSAVSGATIGDWSAIADYQNVQQAFQELLRDASAVRCGPEWRHGESTIAQSRLQHHGRNLRCGHERAQHQSD